MKKATHWSLFPKLDRPTDAGLHPRNAYRPFFESRVPTVAPWRALNFGFDLQITYKVPLRFTTWQSA